MSGKELYEKYIRLQLDFYNCSCDPWEDIGYKEQDVWNKLAEEIS